MRHKVTIYGTFWERNLQTSKSVKKGLGLQILSYFLILRNFFYIFIDNKKKGDL